MSPSGIFLAYSWISGFQGFSGLIMRFSELLGFSGTNIHSPDFNCDSSDGLQCSFFQIKVIWIRDISGLPYALVGRIVHQRGSPFSLVVRILFGGSFPLSTAWSILTKWIWDFRRFPFSIFIIVPILWFCGLRIINLNTHYLS